MLYCPQCQKQVVVIGIPPGAASAEEIEGLRRDAEAEGRLVLFNPPPFESYRCPACHIPLLDGPGAAADA